MASISDIFDWLNQGGQGDIPGTGGAQANAPAASQSAGPQTPVTPQDYAGNIPPELMEHYNALLQAGVPPQMAHMILTQGAEPPSQQPRRQSGQKQSSQQQSPAYSLGSSLGHLLFGTRGSQQDGESQGQSQGHQGLIHMLSNWFSPPPSGAGDYDTGGLY